jgi:hypothetical protein
MTTAKKAPSKRGPKADTLKIEGNWEDAVKKTLGKKKPSEGWPKEKPATHSQLPYTDQEVHH